MTESAVGAPVVLRGQYNFSEELYVPGTAAGGSSQSPERRPRTATGFSRLSRVAPGEMIPVVRGWVATPARAWHGAVRECHRQGPSPSQ